MTAPVQGAPTDGPGPDGARATSVTAQARANDELEVARLTAGVAALSSFQQVTQQGDGKANMLLAVHVGLAAVLATQLQQLDQVPTHSWLAVAFWVASAAYLTSFVVDGYLIAQVIRPRRAGGVEQNLFALPGPEVLQGEGAAPLPAYSDQIWQMAHAIAVVATQKNDYITRAVGWTSLMVVAAATWLTITAALSR